MTIRNKLWIITIISLLSGILVASTAYISITSIQSSLREEGVASQITKGFGELLVFTNEFSSTPSQRTEQQWQSRYNSLYILAETAKFQSKSEKTLIKSICNRLESISIFFDDLRSHLHNKKLPNKNISAHTKTTQAFLDRLIIETQIATDEAFKLSNIKRQSLLETNHQLNRIMVFLTLMVSVIIISIALMIRRSIVKPVDDLHHEINLIQDGNLNHHISISGTDEISQLGIAFNNMTTNLRDTTISIKDLEGHVEQRTLELQEALRNSNIASKAKSEFMSRMSHELRTPMNAILGFAQLLITDDTLRSSHKGNIKEILDAGYHLLDLINEVLDLAKIESGTIDISKELIPLESLVNDCIAMVKNLAADKQIEITFITSDSFAYADRLRMKQVLINLLSNAIKYNNEKGRVEITVSQSNTRTRIEISDTGHGIPEDKWKVIFEPFSRLGMDAMSVDGTGIGLTIAKQIIELMHGTIGFTSIVGQGTTFWIEVPSNK